MISSGNIRTISIVTIVLSLLLLVIAAIRGELSFAIVFIIPVIIGYGPLSITGALLLFLGLILLFTSFLREPLEREEGVGREIPDDPNLEDERRGSRPRMGGVVLLGPIPIIFGSDWRMASLAIILAILLIVLVYFLLS